MPKIIFDHGLETDLPTLELAEPGFTSDTEKVFVGGNSGNIQIAKQQDVDSLTEQVTTNSDTLNAIIHIDANAELVNSRGTYSTLGERLTNDESLLADIAINIKEYGALGDGVNDDTQAIINAEAAAMALGSDTRLIIPKGTYKITSTVMIRCTLDAEQATFQYYGSGIALVVGDNTAAGIVTSRRTFRLPRVIYMNRSTTGWDGSSTGVQITNLNACHVYVPFIQDFEKGLVVYGYSQGSAYNTLFLGSLWENHMNISLDGDATGWVNQNTFLDGRLQQTLSNGATIDDVNAWQVYMGGSVQPNNNTFIGTSFEGDNISYYRLDISGRNNFFYNCRWEAMNGSTPRVRYRSTAYHNRIDGGYDASKIVETFDGTLGGGEIKDGYGSNMYAFATSGQSIPTGATTVINTWNAPVSRRISYDATSGNFTPRPGRWKISSTACFAPNATGRRIMYLNCNGSVRDTFETPANAGRTSMKVDDIYYFNGSQTFNVSVNQTSGANLALETTSGYVKIQAEYLGY